MTSQEQDAVVGRLMREQKETDRQLGLLRVELDHVGQVLVELGQTLQQSPDRVAFDEEPLPIKFDRSNFPSEILDGAKLQKLCYELREQLQRRDQLRQQARSLGFWS